MKAAGDHRGDAGLSALDRSSAPTRGIALVIASGAAFTCNDSMMKWLRADYPVGEAITLRGLFALLALLMLLPWMGGWRSLRIHDWRAQITRGLLVCLTTVCFIAALRYMPLADAVGIAFSGPLFTVALAGLLLGERIGWRRWSAALFGFAGVLLMVRPSGAGLQPAALLPLVTALGGAVRDVLTRRMSLTDHSNATLAVSILAVVLFGGLSLPLGALSPEQRWIWPTGPHLLLFALAGVLLAIGQYCIIESLRLAQVGLVAPFKYTSYLWALLLGWLVWRDVPELGTALGATMVIGSGLFIFWREQRLATRTVARASIR
ncbi:MAG: DMT family transporter [Gammaproteobacteria bacterium]|nr:DMT family transporter [Gammaproteobacteria bacterium]